MYQLGQSVKWFALTGQFERILLQRVCDPPPDKFQVDKDRLARVEAITVNYQVARRAPKPTFRCPNRRPLAQGLQVADEEFLHQVISVL